MPKWERSKQDDRRQIQGVDDGRYIGHAIIPADADAICRAHNADIDAITAECDELQTIIVAPPGLNEWSHDGDKITAIYSHRPAYAKSEADAKYLVRCHNHNLQMIHERECERDELQRRLAAVLDRLPKGGVWCYTCNRATVPVTEQEPYKHIPIEYNQMKTIFLCPICRRDGYAKDSCVSTLRAIAEGREG